MTGYTPTPDYYNEYIQHGWVKDQAAKVHKYIKRWRGKDGRWQYQYKKATSSARNIAKQIINKNKEISARLTKSYNDLKKNVTDRYKQYQKEQTDKKTREEREKKRKTEEKFIDLVNQERKQQFNTRQHRYVGRVKTPYGYRYFYTQREYDRYMARYNNLMDQDNNPSQMKIKTLKKPETINESMHKVNPNYNNGENFPYAINCQRCTFAFEMRQRGFDVEAGANPENPFDLYSPHSFSDYESVIEYFDHSKSDYKDIKIQPVGDTKTLSFFESEVNNMPNNSRGVIGVQWADYGSGHIVNWVKNGNGVVSIVDAQTGNIYKPNEFFNIARTNNAILYRTDNLPINPDLATRYAMDEDEDDLFVNSKRRNA